MVSPANWHTPEAGPLAVDDQAQQAVVMALLAAHPRRISLAFLDGAAATTGRLRQTLVRAEYRIVERQLTSAPYVALEGDWDAFHQRLPRKLRNELRRRERRLADEGVVASEVSDGTADLDDRFAELLRLEALGWKGEGGTAIASRPDTRAFYRGVAEWAAARGWLRLPSVRLDDRPLAMRFGLEAHGVFYSMKVGFDPAFRAFGPGVMLLRDVIRRSYEAGLERVELLGTIDPHKQQWSTGVRERIALQTFSPAPAGRVDHLLYARAMPLAKRLGAGRLRAVLPGRGGLRI